MQVLHNCGLGILPPSLAATKGIDFSFFSSGYLDGSVPLVYHLYNYFIHRIVYVIERMGYPIR